MEHPRRIQLQLLVYPPESDNIHLVPVVETRGEALASIQFREEAVAPREGITYPARYLSLVSMG